jgi:iron complex outermembrane recepter protein
MSFERLALMLIVLWGAVGPAAAEPPLADKKLNLHIDSQPVGQALNELARQSGLQVAVYEAVSEGVTAPEVTGELSPRDALERLLKGTGLEFEFAEGDVVIVRRERGREVVSQEGASVEEGVKSSERKSEAIRLAQAEGKTETAAEGSDVNLEEIVVTAQKRVERLQDVPVSISVLRGGELEASSLSGAMEALTTVPGVALLPQSGVGSGNMVNIRGVGAASAIFNGSSPIGYYLDGVSFGLIRDAFTPDQGAFDLERVEVLRGPQGTLYGASAGLRQIQRMDRWECAGKSQEGPQ